MFASPKIAKCRAVATNGVFLTKDREVPCRCHQKCFPHQRAKAFPSPKIAGWVWGKENRFGHHLGGLRSWESPSRREGRTRESRVNVGWVWGQGVQVRTPFGRSEELGEPKQVGSDDAGSRVNVGWVWGRENRLRELGRSEELDGPGRWRVGLSSEQEKSAVCIFIRTKA